MCDIWKVSIVKHLSLPTTPSIVTNEFLVTTGRYLSPSPTSGLIRCTGPIISSRIRLGDDSRIAKVHQGVGTCMAMVELGKFENYLYKPGDDRVLELRDADDLVRVVISPATSPVVP